MSKRYDVVIVGAGVLGSCIAYWISSTCKASVCVIDKEMLPAEHASSRNTGIVHSPFYLDPKKKSKIAKASLNSYKMWNTIASENKLPWEKTGLLELAIKKEQDATLEKYSKWAVENGIPSEEIQLLDAPQIKKMEPNIRCHSALYCPREVSRLHQSLPQTYPLYHLMTIKSISRCFTVYCCFLHILSLVRLQVQ